MKSKHRQYMYRQHLRETFGIINNSPAGIYGIQGEGWEERLKNRLISMSYIIFLHLGEFQTG